MGCKMPGYVVAVIRAYPKEVREDLDSIVDKIRQRIGNKAYNIMKWEPIDIAFGYRAIDLYISMPEDIGGTEEIEEIIKSVEDIENVDIVYITRIGA